MKNLMQSFGLFLLFYAGHFIASEGPNADLVTMMKIRYINKIEEIRWAGLESLREIDTSMMSEREKSKIRLMVLGTAFKGGLAVTRLAHRELCDLESRLDVRED